MKYDYRIEELVRVIKFLDQSQRKMPAPNMVGEAVSKGIALSKMTCADQPFVFATPWMKNLLVICGDVHPIKGKDGKVSYSKLASGKESKAVDLVNKWVDACLRKFNGKERDSYNEDLPVSDPDHYDTDCWLGWKPKIWDIQPGQAKAREEAFREYSKPTYYDVDKLLKDMQDPVFQKACLLTLEVLPEVMAGRDIKKLSDPFLSKGTGVSYPDYRNDRTKVPGLKITYGEYEVELAKKAAAVGFDTLKKFAYDNNVYTGYPRNQRGKGRALEAQSRRTNLVVNLVNGPEMEAHKISPILGTGFGDEQRIKADLIKFAEFVEQHPDYVARNEDSTAWDRTVGSGWVTLAAALRYLKGNGKRTKDLIEIRHNCARRSKLITGKGVQDMFGRTPSGYDDTTLQNCTVHRALANAALLSGDKDYSRNVVYPSNMFYILILGDDILMLMRKGPEYVRKFREYYKRKGYTIHSDEKSIFGVMFIQWRLIRHPKTKEWIMAYNWPRVLRSMLSKQTAKQLGRYGWTVSGWQQLGKLIQYPEMLAIPLNIVAALDKDHLMLDVPVSQIKAGIEAEDREAQKQIPETRGRKPLSTAERLLDNPTLPGAIQKDDGSTEIDWDYFARLQRAFREVYDPEFLPKLGFENPDLSLVK